MFKILLVDDNSHVRNLLRMGMRRMFEQLELSVDIVEASEGREAIGKLQDASYDLVMTDYYMPVMDGEQVIRHIRETDQRTPILATSASNETIKWQLLEAGADAFIPKPMRSKDLAARVKSLLMLG